MTHSNLIFTESQPIPEGYKKTEVGIIPNDWIVRSIGDFAPLQRGFDLPSRLRVDGLYPVIYSNGFVNTHIEYKVKGPGIVTGRSGTIGKVHYVDQNYWPHNTSLWVTKFNEVDPKFIYFLFSKIGFERFSSGSGVPTLNRNDAHSFKIQLPKSIDEQQKIATVLSDTDALISKLEKLIEKKQAIKTATMQQLLTGKTRLPEFALCEDGTPKTYKDSELGQIPDDWYVRKLGELVEITSGESPSKFNFVNDGIPYFKVEQLNNGNFYAESTPYSVKLGKTILAGSLIFPKRGASILSNKIRILKVNACMDTNLMALTCSHELNPNYLLYSLSYGGLDKVADTTSIPQINNKHILPYKIFYPFIGEQIRISSILVDLENDIELSQQKVEKLRKIKLGMMQELLTGKTRLV